MTSSTSINQSDTRESSMRWGKTTCILSAKTSVKLNVCKVKVISMLMIDD